MGPQKVTTYNKVLPYAIDFEDPRFFLEFCEDQFRYYGLGFDLMDLNKDGKVSYTEVSTFTDDEAAFSDFILDIATALLTERQDEDVGKLTPTFLGQSKIA